MGDHDTYVHRLIGFKARYGRFKSSDELSDHIRVSCKKTNKNNENNEIGAEYHQKGQRVPKRRRNDKFKERQFIDK